MGAFPLRWHQKDSGGRKLAARPQINDVATKRAEDRGRWVQGKGKIRNEWGLKRKRLCRVVVKDLLISMGIMSLFIIITYQWDFISPLTFIKDKKTQRSVEKFKTFDL